jgi:hypothetical protein
MQLYSFRKLVHDFPSWDISYEIWRDTYFDVSEERMPEVRKGASRNTKNENKRRKYI